MVLEAKPLIEGQVPQNSVQMPEPRKIIQKLRRIGLYRPETPKENREFYDLFAGSIGRTTRTGASLNWAWVRALSNVDVIKRNEIDEKFGTAIDAIIPDPEVASDAKEVWTRIQEETRRMMER